MPAPEATYKTTRGLRFADENAYEASLARAHTLAQETVVLQRFGACYGLNLSIDNAVPSSVVGPQATWSYLADSDAGKLKAYLILFIDEWSKYPRGWPTATGIQTIFFVTDLTVNGQARSAMPDPYSKSLFLQVPRFLTDEVYLRAVIHHEFDHCIEHDLFGSFDRNDPDWTKFNPRGFQYGHGGITAYTGKFVNSPHPRVAFIDAYAMTGIEEDKAEIYAYLFTTEKYNAMKAWLQADPQLAGKVANYKALIKRKVPLMDNAYFDAINPLPNKQH